MKHKLRSETALKSRGQEAQEASSSVREGQTAFNSAQERSNRVREAFSRAQTAFNSAREVLSLVREGQTVSSSVREGQTGRSMVEMLGVLAVIGVLSIGGIAGYTQAMSSYKANEIVDTIAKLDVVVQTACARKSKEEYAPINVDFTDLDIKGPVAGCATNIIVNKDCRRSHVNVTIEGCQNETRLVNTLKSLLAHRTGQDPHFGSNGEIIVSFREDR